MKREITYMIDVAYSGYTVGTFLKAKGYSRNSVIELKKAPRGIMKNNQPVGVREQLMQTDRLVITLEETEVYEKIKPSDYRFEVVYEDEDLLVINKPANTPIHPSIHNYEGTLANQVMAYALEKKENYPFRCINRLDRDTTGVTVIAKHLLSASKLGEAVSKKAIKRTYIALVEGITPESGSIELPIGRDENSIIKRKIDEVSGKHALTHYVREQVIETKGKAVSLVRLSLETGRTHQIRVHMAAIGHPLLGDFLYNTENDMMDRQALHGIECVFEHPVTGEEMVCNAPIPQDMQQLIDA